MGTLKIIIIIVNVLRKLIPIALQIYNEVNDPAKPNITRENALDLIKQSAKKKGLSIGNTEAELARSALHFVFAKWRKREKK